MARRAVLIVVLVNAAFIAALALWARAGWAGRPNHLLAGNAYYCEALRPGPIKQPANTLSNFGFVLMGLWLATRVRSARGAVFALIISLLGPASMALHASFTAEGGMIDVGSMFLFIGFATAHDATRLSPSIERNYASATALWLILMAIAASFAHEHGPWTFGVLVTLFLLVEAATAIKNAAPQRDRRRLLLATIFFFSGFACWKASETTTSIWCSPYSYVQGHAAWHLFCALAAGAIFWYLEPELLEG